MAFVLSILGLSSSTTDHFQQYFFMTYNNSSTINSSMLYLVLSSEYDLFVTIINKQIGILGMVRSPQRSRKLMNTARYPRKTSETSVKKNISLNVEGCRDGSAKSKGTRF